MQSNQSVIATYLLKKIHYSKKQTKEQKRVLISNKPEIISTTGNLLVDNLMMSQNVENMCKHIFQVFDMGKT